MTKKFKINDEEIKRSDSIVGVSLHLQGNVDLGKINGQKYYGFICLRCKRLRPGTRQKNGNLKCLTCGYEPTVTW